MKARWRLKALLHNNQPCTHARVDLAVVPVRSWLGECVGVTLAVGQDRAIGAGRRVVRVPGDGMRLIIVIRPGHGRADIQYFHTRVEAAIADPDIEVRWPAGAVAVGIARIAVS